VRSEFRYYDDELILRDSTMLFSSVVNLAVSAFATLDGAASLVLGLIEFRCLSAVTRAIALSNAREPSVGPRRKQSIAARCGAALCEVLNK
jgi:hypothetical protein